MGACRGDLPDCVNRVDLARVWFVVLKSGCGDVIETYLEDKKKTRGLM